MQANHKFRAGILNKAALMSSPAVFGKLQIQHIRSDYKEKQPGPGNRLFIKRFVLKAIYTSFINSAGLPAR